MTPSFIARQSVFARGSVPTWFESAAANLPANCMFVVAPIDGLRPVIRKRILHCSRTKSSQSVEWVEWKASGYWTTPIDEVE